jgi:hypothetical protein
MTTVFTYYAIAVVVAFVVTGGLVTFFTRKGN